MSNKYLEDEHLLKQIKSGDRTLLNALYQKYKSFFCAYFYKHHALPEEEVLDIYTKAFTSFYFNIKDGKLVPPLQSSLQSYLFGIGKNYFLKYWTKLARKKEYSVGEWDEEFEPDFQQPGIYDYYEKHSSKVLVQNLLAQLDAPCRELLQLSFIEENADDAIAVKMKVSSTVAVRQRRFKCLEKLRKLMHLK